jgi:hypothetical protein
MVLRNIAKKAKVILRYENQILVDKIAAVSGKIRYVTITVGFIYFKFI